jgi:signal transduction histidine kinase
MLHEFLTDNEPELIKRCRAKAAERLLPRETREALHHGIPLFLRQLIRTLAMEQTSAPLRSRAISGPSGGARGVASEMGHSAAIHGRELLDHGFTIDQVVHAYGDVCQSITDLAFDRGEPFQIDEFRTLNRCLDNAIAEAVTEFCYQRDALFEQKQTQVINERLGFLAHELRNQIQTATLVFAAIKAGHVGLGGATSGVMDRTLVALQRIIDGSISEVRMGAGMALHTQLFSLAEFVVDVKISASLEAEAHECACLFSSVDKDLAIKGDRHLLSAAVTNLLQNAFKFTHPGTEVSLSAYAAADRIRIDVSDHCGGLPWSDADKLFVPFTQGGSDKRGLGLGLSIVKRSVEANEGTLRVHDRPGEGCTFTIDLPRHSIREGLDDSRHAKPMSVLL